ncbi:TPA: VWA domain-containing protein [Candidatus Avigastranaerophilus faecigallinarum]|nr:VWA domain-containing protein [Candidatus Avigastranaerophilus faecigallinarum]
MKKFLVFIFLYFIFINSTNAEPNFTYSTPDNYKFSNSGFETNDNSREKILFIVDFSNSMNERLGHRTKLDIALSTMKETLQQLPQNVEVGLRVYGHRTGFTPRQSCSASQLVSPIQKNNAINIYSRLNSINAVGWTPITYSLKQAVFSDFTDTTSKKRIILISDGGENCDESPCDFIIELMKYRDDIRIDVIALAIGDKDANNQLKCVALVTSGKFYNANTAAELKNSLQDSLNLEKEVQGVILNQ